LQNTKEKRSGYACEIITGSSAGQSPAGKNPHPSFLWACTVFLSASAQSTLRCFFSVPLFAKGKKVISYSNCTTNPKMMPRKPFMTLMCVSILWKHKNHNRFSKGDIGHNPFFSHLTLRSSVSAQKNAL
jgi:hypothetical protein